MDFLLNGGQDIAKRTQFPVGHKRHHYPLPFTSACTSGTMDINVRVVGKVINEDVADPGKIKPPRGNVGRYKESDLPGPELSRNDGAHVLAEAGMEIIDSIKPLLQSPAYAFHLIA